MKPTLDYIIQYFVKIVFIELLLIDLSVNVIQG